MMFVKLDSIDEREVVEGFHARFVHTERSTIAFWRIEAEKAIPTHSHPHEQTVLILEGEFELTVAGQPKTIRPGDFVVIPPEIPHSARSITDCRLVDTFCPVREDYR
jgi:quercetin dioxygenase-like cupin family protein